MMKSILFLCTSFFFVESALSQTINQSALFTNSQETTSSASFTISLLLPFDEARTNSKLNDFFNSTDANNAKAVQLKNSAVEALDFYEGFQSAIKLAPPSFEVKVQVFDVGYNDTLLANVLSDERLSLSNVIVGPSTVTGAKTISDYCKKNRIINLQPFVINKNLGNTNPYLLKIEPAIEEHIDRMFKTIVDSFADRKIIVYCSNKERELTPAYYMDFLLNNYNSKTTNKIKHLFINRNDTTVSDSYKDLATHADANTVVVYCSYDAAPIEQALRLLSREKAIVFGMPTWIDNDFLRVDYMNNATLHFTDIFSVDTSSEQQQTFDLDYKNTYKHNPTRASYLGYDICEYLFLSLQLNGLKFAERAVNNPYKGIGYNFNFGKIYTRTKNDTIFLYYGNKAVHQFKINDYQFQLVE